MRFSLISPPLLTPYLTLGLGAGLFLVMLAGPPLAVAAVISAHVAWHHSWPGHDSRGRSLAALVLGYSSIVIAAGFVALGVYVVWSVFNQPWFTF